MKILQLISSRGVYGAENMAIELSIALRKSGCEVVIGAFRNKQFPNTDILTTAQREGFEFRGFDCSGKFDWRTVRTIRKYLRTNQIDLLHAHGYKANIYGLMARRDTPTRQVSTAHGWPGKTKSLRLYAALDRMLLRFSDHVSAVSPNVAEQLMKYRTPLEKLSIVHNGLDPARYSGGTPVLKNLPDFHGEKIVGFVGRLAPEKGIANLIHAAKEVLSVYPQVLFVLVGDGPERAALESLVKSNGLEKTVIFVGQRSDLTNIYNSFDIFVLPSLTEAMPMAILEAMAAGKPIIASRVGGIPEMISDLESGLLITPGDQRGLRDALLKLLREPETALRLSEAASKMVRTRFSSDRMAQAYLSIYCRLLPLATDQFTAIYPLL